MDPLPDFNLDNVITKTNTLKQDFDSLVSEARFEKDRHGQKKVWERWAQTYTEDIAQDYGITRERVRQIVQNFGNEKWADCAH